MPARSPTACAATSCRNATCIHRDSRQTPNPALPTPAGAPDGADEESDLRSTGVSHNKRRLHKVGYFRELLSSNAEVNESIRPLLRVSRDSIVRLQKTDTPWSVPYSGTLCWRSESNASGPFLE